MPDDSVYQQIVDGLVSRCEGMEAASGFWYPPQQVLQASWLSEAVLDNPKDSLYIFVPDVEEEEDLTFGGGGNGYTKALMRLDLVACRRYRAAKEDPRNNVRWRDQNRLAQDAKNRLRGDYTVSGLALHTKIPVIDRSAEETWHPTWAVVFLRLELEYTYVDGAA